MSFLGLLTELLPLADSDISSSRGGRKNKETFNVLILFLAITGVVGTLYQLISKPYLIDNIGWRFVLSPLALLPALGFIIASYKLNLLVTLSKSLLVFISIVFLLLGFCGLAFWVG